MAKSVLTLEQVLAMPQHKRQTNVTRDDARRLELVLIDGPGSTTQFVGTEEENTLRIKALHGMMPGRRK